VEIPPSPSYTALIMVYRQARSGYVGGVMSKYK